MNNPSDIEIPVRFDPASNVYRASFESAQLDPSVAVVWVVATVCGKKPTALEPLYNTVDPDALDAFLAVSPPDRDPVNRFIEFSYHGYTVWIISDGLIEVQPHPEHRPGTTER